MAELKVNDERVKWLRETAGDHDIFDLLDDRDALVAEVERLRKEASDRAAAMVHVNRWGFKLTEALGKFCEACLESKRPLTTTINIAFPDMPDQPVMRLWATTDEQDPVSRIGVVVQEREEARAECQRLAGLLNELALARAAAAPPAATDGGAEGGRS
jgi:hypothetical protein